MSGTETEEKLPLFQDQQHAAHRRWGYGRQTDLSRVGTAQVAKKLITRAIHGMRRQEEVVIEEFRL